MPDLNTGTTDKLISTSPPDREGFGLKKPLIFKTNQFARTSLPLTTHAVQTTFEHSSERWDTPEETSRILQSKSNNTQRAVYSKAVGT